MASSYKLDEALHFDYNLLAGPLTPQFGTAAVRTTSAAAVTAAAKKPGRHPHGQHLLHHATITTIRDASFVDPYVPSPSDQLSTASTVTNGGSPEDVHMVRDEDDPVTYVVTAEELQQPASADDINSMLYDETQPDLFDSFLYSQQQQFARQPEQQQQQLPLKFEQSFVFRQPQQPQSQQQPQLPQQYMDASPGSIMNFRRTDDAVKFDPKGNSPSASTNSTEKSDGSDDTGEVDFDEPVAAPVTSRPLFSSFRLTGITTKSPVAKKSNSSSDTAESPSGPGGERLVRHNQSEKKRRDNMNECITELHNIVPALHTVHKPSKGAILTKTIDYLKRLQLKSHKLESSLSQTQDELTQQRNFNHLLLQVLNEHGIIVPDDVSKKQGSASPNASTPLAGYFMQDAGRVTLLATALLYFFFAPWSSSSAYDDTVSSGGRALLSIPFVDEYIFGASSVVYWFLTRLMVMTFLLTIATYWDTRYCDDSIIESLPTISKLNREAEMFMTGGNYLEAKIKTEEALSLLKRPVPRSNFDLFFGNLYQSGRQIAHRCITGLVMERFLIYSFGQMAYVAELQRAYLNMTQQNHCLPHYNKWRDLYIILCSVNFSEIIEGDTGQGLVQAYGALCYHVVVHSRVFEVFASIYQSLAFGVVKRLGLNKAQFGNFYVVIAYRNLMKGDFPKVFDNLNKGIEMHKMFKLEHHHRECVMMKGWIEHILGRPSHSTQTFLELYHWAENDNDNYSKRWAMLGIIANFLHTGQLQKASEWLHSESVLDEDLRKINNHQEIFVLGFKATLHLREGFEDGALEVANKTLDRVQDTLQSGMPHNVMPLWKTIEVHLTLLEHNQQLGNDRKVAQLHQLCKKDLEVFSQYIMVFPLMEIAYLVYWSRHAFLSSGDEEKSLEALRRARDKAQVCGIKLMEALAHFEYGRLLPVDHPQRLRSLEDALQIFTDIEATYEAQLTQAEMKTKFASRLFTPQPQVLA